MSHVTDKISLFLNERKNSDEYERFFEKKLKEWGIKSPKELSRKDRQKFFDQVEKEGTKEKNGR